MFNGYGIDNQHTRVVVHFLRAINETTGGYREFAVWRAEHIESEKNIVFVCGCRMECRKKDFSEIEVVWGNKDIRRTRQKIKEICAICEKKGIPLIFHIQQPGAIRDIMKACVGLNIRKNMVYTMKSTFSGYADKATKWNCVLAALYARHLSFLSHASYDDYPILVKLLKHGNISVIEHGACQEGVTQIDWEKRKDMNNNRLELVYTARIVQVKNHMFLLDVIEELENVHITMIGGEQRSVLRNEVRKRHLENKITITGYVSREEVYELLGRGDIYVSPSKVEGLPVSVLEAMHMGLPIVLSDISPHTELAQRTKGIIILSLKKELWVKVLNRLGRMRTDELAELGKRNVEAAKKYFTLDRMHKRYSCLYRLLE